MEERKTTRKNTKFSVKSNSMIDRYRDTTFFVDKLKVNRSIITFIISIYSFIILEDRVRGDITDKIIKNTQNRKKQEEKGVSKI